MEPPKISKYGSRQFRIEYRDDIEEGGEECNGLTELDKKLISIKKGLDPDLESEVLVHEVMHQLISHSGLGLSDALEERVVTFLGMALTGHMKENKRFWAYVRALTK